MYGQTVLRHRGLHFAMFLLIGAVFIYKYAFRISETLMWLIIPYFIINYILLFHLKDGIGNRQFSKYLTWTALLVGGIGSFIVFQWVEVQSLMVDRWSVITHYWDAFYQGQNPYSSTSHMGNYYGSYPFYFIFSLPFYWIGEIGWMPLTALVFFLILIYKISDDHRQVSIALVLAVVGLCIPYEIVTRSTLFFNSVLVLLAIIYFIRSWESDHKWEVLIPAFIVGLLVCSRPVYGLVFAIMGIYVLRKAASFQKVGLTLLFSLLGLGLPFLHLYVLFPESIMEYNPISFMTSHFVPTWFYGIYLILALVLSYFCKSMTDVIRAAGVFMFLVVCVYGLRYVLMYGWLEAIFAHHIDISYFFMASPFIIYSIIFSDRQVRNSKFINEQTVGDESSIY